MINISPTHPAGRSLLQAECSHRIDKGTGVPINPEKMTAVYFKGVNRCMGVIACEPKEFVTKWFVGKEVKDPNLEITFIGYKETIVGTITDLVEYATDEDGCKDLVLS
jgi:hypothetical protein